MYQHRHLFINIFILLVITYICIGLQTNFWFSIVGSVASPQLWLIIALYVTLYRKVYHSVFINYLIGIILTSFSSASIGMLWPTLLIITVLAYFVKSRMFWPSTRYFIVSTFSFTLLFHIVYFIFSKTFEVNAVRMSLFARITEILLTGLFAAPLYWFLSWIDHITLKETLSESTGAAE